MIPNTPSAKEKTKALDLALQQIEKQFGKGAIMKLGEESAQVAVEIIPSGSIALDMALGIGGIPRGRVIEIYGPESSGKTTLALTIIANAQRRGGNAVFIDAEHALDAAYAQKLGVDIANLHVAQPDTGEEALEIADHLVRSGAVDVVVIDSVAALVPRAEIEGEMGDSHVGLQARLMSQALRKLTGSISKSRTSVIFINQIRMQIGIMFGNPETTAGGRALKFYASVRLDIRRIATLKEGDVAVGNRTKVKVVKNKVAAPFREAEFDIVYNEGISREGELIDFALEKGVIQRSGTWFSFGEERIGQGRENARLFLKEHADVRAQLEAKLLPMLGLKAPVATDSVPAAAEPARPAAPGVSGKPTPGAASPRPQPAMVASGDRKR
jgi:recombination protein RecA